MNRLIGGLGASNHADEERQEDDFYATEPKAVKLLLELEEFDDDIWECAAGKGHISEILEDAGYNVVSSDLVDRGVDWIHTPIDFLKCNKNWRGDIITNPPYKHAQEFIEKALELINDGNKVAMFLKIQFLESQTRKQLFEKYPPKRVWISSSRLFCAKNGEFHKYKATALCYCWYIWIKGDNSVTQLKWFN